MAVTVCGTSIVYTAGSEGYDTFRIPAIVRASGGTLLAFAEGRRAGPGDSGDIDLVLRRSFDAGRSWGDLQVVLTHGTDTAGNPCPVVDPASGDVVLVTTRNGGGVTEQEILRGTTTHEDGRRVFVQRSADEGATWSEPVEITHDAKKPFWRWYATGPGHGIALHHGEFAGRLVAPANYSEAGSAPGSYGAHAILSDDGGRTWRIGAVDPGTRGWVNPNESGVTELPGGSLLFNARDQHGGNPSNRIQARSKDGGESFAEPYTSCASLTTPVVQGSVVAARGALWFAAPYDREKRVRMSLRRSLDGGSTWQRLLELTDEPAAYSDLVDLGAGTIGLLYEVGAAGPYEQIRFHQLEVQQ